MEITILGTAAAEGWPAVFCKCETCRRAREAGGKNIRSRASVLFGAHHRIDLGPDTWYHEAVLGADFSELRYLFVTHSHGDHWTPEYLGYLRPPFAHGRTEPLMVYGNAPTIVGKSYGALANGSESVILTGARSFEPIRAGEYVVTPIRASHMRDEECLCYVMQAEGKTVLYGSDTGWYPDDTWAFLQTLRFDCVIHECTCGPVKCENYHMDFDHLFAAQDRLATAGSIGSDSLFVVTHFSHNVGLLHDEIESIVRERRMQVAYDGMKIRL